MGQQLLSHQSVSSQLLANEPAISTLPLLDLSLLSGSNTERQAFLTALRHAAREVGFFILPGMALIPRYYGRYKSYHGSSLR